MGIEASINEGPSPATCIALCGSIDISVALDLKAALMEGLEKGQEIELSAEEATDFDVTALQLLWAAQRECKNAGLRFALSGAPAGLLESTLAEMGMKPTGFFS